jgi:hypothetical protein
MAVILSVAEKLICVNDMNLASSPNINLDITFGGAMIKDALTYMFCLKVKHDLAIQFDIITIHGPFKIIDE